MLPGRRKSHTLRKEWNNHEKNKKNGKNGKSLEGSVTLCLAVLSSLPQLLMFAAKKRSLNVESKFFLS